MVIDRVDLGERNGVRCVRVDYNHAPPDFEFSGQSFGKVVLIIDTIDDEVHVEGGGTLPITVLLWAAELVREWQATQVRSLDDLPEPGTIVKGFYADGSQAALDRVVVLVDGKRRLRAVSTSDSCVGWRPC